jgi:hypothetical protein
MTLLDIADAQGGRISEEIFKGMKPTDQYSPLKWPRNSDITTKQRNLWKAALKAAFTVTGMILKQSLGKWTRCSSQVWRSFYNLRTQQVITSTTGSVTRFTEYMVHHRTRHHVDATPVAAASVYTSLEMVDWNIMIPASVRNTHARNVIGTFNANETMTNQEGDGPETFKQYIKTLPEHIQ